MNQQLIAPIPEVYILWHPSCSIGERLATRIYTWLRPGNGLGPQVFYRSLPAPETPMGLPPPLPGETSADAGESKSARRGVSNLQIILPLIDAHMVADLGWRYWLDRLGSANPSLMQREIIPVALDTTAYNMPATLRERNYLRPGGLPLREGEVLTDPIFEDIARSLLKQLTEALCQTMLPRLGQTGAQIDPSPSPDKSLHKLKIFLSHAKVDGLTPARRLRDYIYSQTQLAAFYDENDIAFGSIFSRVIKDDLNSSDTAALIAIRSRRYASRPWCRRELSMFRRPREEKPLSNGIQNWRLFPIVVVDAMEGGQISAGIPELGNSSIIRWSDDGKNLEELIVTTVIRDAMLASFHSAMGASIAERLGYSAGDTSGSNTVRQIIINWLPDPTTLLQIDAVHFGSELDVVYPGGGLSGVELNMLQEYFPNLTFRSFEGVFREYP
jgi:hypothetical protein